MCLASYLFLASQLPELAYATGNPEQTPEVSEEQEQETETRTDTESGQKGTTESGQQESDSMLDRHKQFMDTQVQRATQWVDGFFANTNDYAESTNNQFRLRPEYYYRDKQGTKLNLKVRARLELPKLSRRLSFVAGSDDDVDPSGEFNDDSERNNIAGLQFLLRDSAHWHTSIIAGAKFKDFAFFLGPRFRYQFDINDKTLTRFTQTFRWQTNNRWDIGSRGDLYYVLNESLYFRQTIYGRWQDKKDDEEGLQTQVSSVLSQRLSPTSGMQYDFTTIVNTEPDTHVDKYTVSLRYRKQTPKEWLYYEIAPQVSFEDRYDFKANPGIRLRLELYYGKSGSGHFWQHDPDTQASEEE